MATEVHQNSTSSKKQPRTRRTGTRDPLAVTLLKKDHREVENWFDEAPVVGISMATVSLQRTVRSSSNHG